MPIVPYLARLLNVVQASPLLHHRIRRFARRLIGTRASHSSYVAEGCHFSGPVEIGDRAFINIGCFIDGCAKVTLGAGVSLGPYVRILTGTHEIGGTERRSGKLKVAPVTIGAGSWIGAGAMIMPGVTIAEGCVVGSGAVVTKDTEPNGLYAGVPAVRIRDLPHTP